MQAPCPFLPAAAKSMSFRDLQVARMDGPESAYRVNLSYAQWLWQHGLPARAILAMDKALFLCLPVSNPAVRENPLPYAALVWIVRHAKAGQFLGNPRVHYQHLADRVRGCKACHKALRAWACWHLVCRWRADFPGDEQHSFCAPDWLATCASVAELFGEEEREYLENIFEGSKLENSPLLQIGTNAWVVRSVIGPLARNRE
jgi:hypothetical protein